MFFHTCSTAYKPVTSFTNIKQTEFADFTKVMTFNAKDGEEAYKEVVDPVGILLSKCFLVWYGSSTGAD